MVKRSRGKTKRRRRAGMSNGTAGGGEVEDMYALIHKKVTGQLDILPYGKITSNAADKMVDNIFSGKPETGGFHAVKEAKRLQKKVKEVLYDPHQMKQEVKNRLQPYVEMKKEERKKKVGVTKGKQSLNLYKGRGSQATIGITDLPHDILGLINKKVKGIAVTDDVLHRIDQGQTKKKKKKKKKKGRKQTKKRRRSKRY